ncbi:hypothetical protein EVJ50_07240 [Synechococcus sp. RSCCF101]|uniref:hypothetical protein n=1 Tax=Synechococcus sp. RSCCF101 TaxID=2511069 RepID=UPI00124594E5|nr:hypothetical protein [Synechococcus sp. RSCCF101]QEY32059.1 hypothetical protein EVJ50_07240 [Synechococcus sp. RSCCF101]
MAPDLSPDDREALEHLLRDWLRHCGRRQSDLRRALRVPSSRMPVILDALDAVHQREGLRGLASTLCRIEGEWKEQTPADDAPEGLSEANVDAQLDLLLQEIRQSGGR